MLLGLQFIGYRRAELGVGQTPVHDDQDLRCEGPAAQVLEVSLKELVESLLGTDLLMGTSETLDDIYNEVH